MGRWLLLVVLGIAVMLGGSIVRMSEVRQVPDLLAPPLDSQFVGNAQLPAEQIRAFFDDASARMRSELQEAKSLARGSRIMEWLSFLLSALVTVIAGALGVISKDAEAAAIALNASEAEKKGARRSRLVVAIGVLAATSAVATAAAGRLAPAASAHVAKAFAIQQVMVQARRDVQAAKTAAGAHDVLDAARLEIEKP